MIEFTVFRNYIFYYKPACQPMLVDKLCHGYMKESVHNVAKGHLQQLNTTNSKFKQKEISNFLYELITSWKVNILKEYHYILFTWSWTANFAPTRCTDELKWYSFITFCSGHAKKVSFIREVLFRAHEDKK